MVPLKKVLAETIPLKGFLLKQFLWRHGPFQDMVPVKQFLWKEFLLKHNPTEKGPILETILVGTITLWKEVLWNNSLEKWFSGKDSLERGCYENNSPTCEGCLEKAVCDRKKIQQVEKAGNEMLE